MIKKLLWAVMIRIHSRLQQPKEKFELRHPAFDGRAAECGEKKYGTLEFREKVSRSRGDVDWW